MMSKVTMGKVEIATELWKAVLSNQNCTLSTALQDDSLFRMIEELAERIYNRLSPGN